MEIANGFHSDNNSPHPIINIMLSVVIAVMLKIANTDSDQLRAWGSFAIALAGFLVMIFLNLNRFPDAYKYFKYVMKKYIFK